MIDGVVQVVTRLYAEGQIDGVVAAGGAQGTAIATPAMRALPVGIPKVMVSTVALRSHDVLVPTWAPATSHDPL